MIETSPDRDIVDALRRVARSTIVPPLDAGREAALLAAFDGRATPRRRSSGGWVWLSGLAAAVALLIAAGLPTLSPSSGSPSAAPAHEPQRTSAFIPWPGASALPPLESGELVRMSLPVSMLPSLGVIPPSASRAAEVTADVVVGQDGLPRALRLVD